MYIVINENSLKVNNLTRNADKLIVAFGNSIKLMNHDDFMGSVSRNEEPFDPLDETFRGVAISKPNKIQAVKEFCNLLETVYKIPKENYKLNADLFWNSNGVESSVRVVIPQEVVFSNANYRGLVSHVELLMSEGRAYFYQKDGLVFLYFVTLLPEHEYLLSQDINVLIEYK